MVMNGLSSPRRRVVRERAGSSTGAVQAAQRVLCVCQQDGGSMQLARAEARWLDSALIVSDWWLDSTLIVSCASLRRALVLRSSTATWTRLAPFRRPLFPLSALSLLCACQAQPCSLDPAPSRRAPSRRLHASFSPLSPPLLLPAVFLHIFGAAPVSSAAPPPLWPNGSGCHWCFIGDDGDVALVWGPHHTRPLQHTRARYRQSMQRQGTQ